MKIFLNFQEKRALILMLLEHDYKNDSRIFYLENVIMDPENHTKKRKILRWIISMIK